MAYLYIRVCDAATSQGGMDEPVEEWSVRCRLGDLDYGTAQAELERRGYESLTPLDCAPASEWPLTATVHIGTAKDGSDRYTQPHLFPVRKKTTGETAS